MICGSCGAQNWADRLFCLRCGTSLRGACPNCGAPNEPEAAFCGRCGTRLPDQPASSGEVARSAVDATSPASGAERRLVSVLFADLVGFTTASEGRDPEDTRELLEHYFAAASEVIARYGGTVEKFIGDAVMAVWGTPSPTRMTRSGLSGRPSISSRRSPASATGSPPGRVS